MRVTFVSFTIWILSACINALLNTILLTFSDGQFTYWPGVFALALVFSLLFSAPGIFIFWLVFICNTDHENLFRLLLRTGIICAVMIGLLFVLLLGNEFKGQSYYMASFGVIASLASIMIHHRNIMSFKNE